MKWKVKCQGWNAFTLIDGLQTAGLKLCSVILAGGTGLGLRKSKAVKGSSATATAGPASARFGEGVASANAGLTIRDPVTGAQYVQIQLLQVGNTQCILGPCCVTTSLSLPNTSMCVLF